jgi:HNH endonuclease
MEKFKEYFTYNPETGVFRRRKDGKIAGTQMKYGYIRLYINRDYALAHRVAWYIVHGELPPPELDHIDGDPSNNRIANLRKIAPALNRINRHRLNLEI